MDDYGVKDGTESKSHISQNSVHDEERESGSDHASVATSNHELSPSAPPESMSIAVEDTQSSHQISPTNPAQVEEKSPQRASNWIPSPQQSFKTEVKEKKMRHSAIYTDDTISTTLQSTPPPSPLGCRRFTAVYQQGNHLSAEACATQQDGETCPVSPPSRGKSGSPRLVRKHAIRVPRRSIADDSSGFPRRLRSFSTDVQQSTFKLASTMQGVSKDRRYTVPTLQQAADRNMCSTSDNRLNTTVERDEVNNANTVQQSPVEAETIPVNGITPAENSDQCNDNTGESENDKSCQECPIPE